MLYGKNKSTGEIIQALPGGAAICPHCGGVLIAKCGTVNAWHWAHRQRDCDLWHEPEGAWHLGWKSMAPKEWTEVSMGPHRADIRRDDGLVIELQASSISAEEIAEREAFYGEMVWLLDGREFVFESHCHILGNADVCCPYESDLKPYYGSTRQAPPTCNLGRHVHSSLDGYELLKEGAGWWYLRHANKYPTSARWKQRRRSFDSAYAPIYVDLGCNGVFEITRRGPPENRYVAQPEARQWLQGFYHSRQEFAAAAGLMWRADALGD